MKKLMLIAVLFIGCSAVYRSVCASGSAAEEPLFVVTHVDVMPNFAAIGRELLQQFAVESRKDAGAERIEVLEETLRPNHSTVIEVWKTRKAYDDHLALEHTRAYRTKLQPMLGSPFDERLHKKNGQ